MDELDEWRSAVRHSTDRELELAQDSHRAALGLIGEAGDDL